MQDLLGFFSLFCFSFSAYFVIDTVRVLAGVTYKIRERMQSVRSLARDCVYKYINFNDRVNYLCMSGYSLMQI